MNDAYFYQLIMLAGILLLVLIPGIFYLLTLQNTLKAISPEGRMMPPANVWLLLIPVFNIVYHFIVVGRIADSIKNECIRLNIPLQEDRPTYNLGLTMLLIYIASTILSYSRILGTLSGVGSIACLVYWIMYWVKVNNYRKLIIANRDNFMLDAERELAQSQT
jgi:hypothetical protein